MTVLRAVSGFFSQVSEPLLTYLNFALRRAEPVLTPFDLIKQVLFDVLGPSTDVVDSKTRSNIQTIDVQIPFNPLGVDLDTFRLRQRDTGIEVTTIQRAGGAASTSFDGSSATGVDLANDTINVLASSPGVGERQPGDLLGRGGRDADRRARRGANVLRGRR